MEAALPTLPFWFKQRQCSAEVVGEHTLKVTGPNLGEALLLIRRDESGLWQAAVSTPDQEDADLAATPFDLDSEPSAWAAAFELYRIHFIF